MLIRNEFLKSRRPEKIAAFCSPSAADFGPLSGDLRGCRLRRHRTAMGCVQIGHPLRTDAAWHLSMRDRLLPTRFRSPCAGSARRSKFRIACAPSCAHVNRASSCWRCVVGALAGLVVAAMGEAVALMHLTFFGLDPGERLSGRGLAQPALRVFHALPRRAAVRPCHRLHHPPARHRGRPGRSQCPAWRAHVVARQPDRGGADRVVERRRRLGRPGGRLHPACQRHRLQDRPGISPAPQRHAHAGRLRRRRRPSPALSARRWAAPSMASS